MTPTEHEGTVALEAAARRLWEDRRKSGPLPPWDELGKVSQLEVKNELLPYVWAALEALPDRVEGLQREWGRQIKDDSRGNGHLTGFVSSTFEDPEAAAASLQPDQRVVVRRVTEWAESEDA